MSDTEIAKKTEYFQKWSFSKPTQFISKCCLRPLYDEYGNVYIVVDMELKGLIREALIKMILGFDIALEIEEE